MMCVLVSDFHYDLPAELIAQRPLGDRAASRLLSLNRASGKWADRQFRDFPNLLRPDDLLVFNNTRVFPARLYGHRVKRSFSIDAESQGKDGDARSRDCFPGRIEALLTRQLSVEPNDWECLVSPGKKIGVGERLYFANPELAGASASLEAQNELRAEVIGRGEFGERRIRFMPVNDFFERVEKIGQIPLPPYIARQYPTCSGDNDRDRYQTVYAQHTGSAAAPTAGLHFTPEILARIRDRGIETSEITLHIGLGTFQPVRVTKVEEHKLHSESFSISSEAAAQINGALAESRRVIAIGTTTARTLEYAAQRLAAERVQIAAGSGEANIFIYPGYTFRVISGLLTNFHLPESTLLMLVSTFGEKENVMSSYKHAVSERYRFYSYGDCMFLE